MAPICHSTTFCCQSTHRLGQPPQLITHKHETHEYHTLHRPLPGKGDPQAFDHRKNMEGGRWCGAANPKCTAPNQETSHYWTSRVIATTSLCCHHNANRVVAMQTRSCKPVGSGIELGASKPRNKRHTYRAAYSHSIAAAQPQCRKGCQHKVADNPMLVLLIVVSS